MKHCAGSSLNYLKHIPAHLGSLKYQAAPGSAGPGRYGVTWEARTRMKQGGPFVSGVV